MRKLIHVICILQTGAIVYLLNLMIEHPYSAINMASAFMHGCKLAAHYSQNETVLNKCTTYAVIYGETLKKIEDQYEEQ